MKARRNQSGGVEISGGYLEIATFKAELVKLGTSVDFFAGRLRLSQSDFLRALQVTRIEVELEGFDSEEVARALISDEKGTRLRDEFIVRLEQPANTQTRWDHVLKAHQKTAVRALTLEGLSGACLFDEQGTGKTLTTIAAFDIIFDQGEVSQLVIVCPKTLLFTWKKEISDFLPKKYSLAIVEGTAHQKQNTILTSTDILLLTYESMAVNSAVLTARIESKPSLIVFDESFMVKNAAAVRSQAALKVRRASKKCFVLCGTPAPNAVVDIVHQFTLADNGYTFDGFQPTGEPLIDTPEVRRRVNERGFYIRRLKDDVLPGLPSKRFVIDEYSLTNRQRELYEETRQNLVLYLNNLDEKKFKKNIATYLQKRMVLIQICVSPALIGDSDSESGKYAKLQELVTDLVDVQSRKVLIWSAFTESTDHIIRLMSKYNPVRVDGTITSPEERQHAVNQFQTDPDTKVFVGNAAAAGAGITLTAADCAIYVSLSNQAVHFMQSVDRIHRIGQNSTQVEYHFLVCPGTIEEYDVGVVSKKQIRQADLLGDSINEVQTLSQALKELEKRMV